MVYFNLTIGKYKGFYQFDKEKNDATDLPYCDANKNIIKRINETEQEKQKLNEVNIQVLRLENKPNKTAQEEEDLKGLRRELNTRTEIQTYKPYYINEKTGETHLKAFKLMGDEVLDGTDGRTKDIPEGDYAFCDLGEENIFMKQEKGTFFSQELYNQLKAQNKAVKFNMKFGRGNNEERVYIYPHPTTANVLIINKVGRTKFDEVIIRNVEDLRQYEELKKMLENIDLENAKKGRNKIAGSLD